GTEVFGSLDRELVLTLRELVRRRCFAPSPPIDCHRHEPCMLDACLLLIHRVTPKANRAAIPHTRRSPELNTGSAAATPTGHAATRATMAGHLVAALLTNELPVAPVAEQPPPVGDGSESTARAD